MNVDQAYQSNVKEEDDDLITGALSELVGNRYIYFYKLSRLIYHLLNTTHQDIEVPFENDALLSVKQIPHPEVSEEAVITYLVKVTKVLNMAESYNNKIITEYLRSVLPVSKYNQVVIRATRKAPRHILRRTLGALLVLVLAPVVVPVTGIKNFVKATIT